MHVCIYIELTHVDDVLVLVVLLHGRHFLFDLEQAINDKIRSHMAARESKRDVWEGKEATGDDVGAVASFNGDEEAEGYDVISEIAAGVFVGAFNDVI